MSHLQYGFSTYIVGFSHDDFNLHHWLLGNNEHSQLKPITLVTTLPYDRHHNQNNDGQARHSQQATIQQPLKGEAKDLSAIRYC